MRARLFLSLEPMRRTRRPALLLHRRRRTDRALLRRLAAIEAILRTLVLLIERFVPRELR